MAIVNENKYEYLKLGPVTGYENFIISSFNSISKKDEHNSKTYKIDISYFTIEFEIFICELKKLYYVNSLKKNLFNSDNINYDLVSNRNIVNFEYILNYISEVIKNNNKFNKFIVSDYYNIKKMNKIQTKFEVNINDLKKIHDIIEDNTISKQYNVPKELVFGKEQIFKLVTDEIVKFNRNMTFKHYIIPDNNNPYSLFVRFIFENKKIKSKLDIIKKKFNFDFIEIKLDINNILYPFYPIKLEFRRPKTSLEFLHSVLNMESLKISNWNPTISLNNFLIELGKEFENKIIDHIDVESKLNSEQFAFSQIEYDLVNFSVVSQSKMSNDLSIDLKFNKIDISKKNKNDDKYWKSGVGYGTNDRSGKMKWNIESYILEKDNSRNKILDLLKKNILNIKNYDNFNLVLKSSIPNYINNFLKSSNILVINKNLNILNTIMIFLSFLISKEYNISEINDNKLKDIIEKSSDKKIEYNKEELNLINSVYSSIKDLSVEISTFLKNEKLFTNIDENLKNNYNQISTIYNWLSKNTTLKIDDNDLQKDFKNIKEEYNSMVVKNIFGNMELNNRHRYYDDSSNKGNVYSPKTMMRIGSELSTLKNSLPTSWDTSIIVRVPEDNMTKISFVIIGPIDTPYHNGVFEFHLKFPQDYPNSPPKVLLETTGGGSVRFNPNLYNSGKVCLSLLGTWNGDASESWTSLSTLLQVMLSIQSLILVEEPYWNEPGWEKSMNTTTGQKKCEDYTDRVRLDNLKWAINNTIKNPPVEYKDFIINHFLLKRKELCEVTEKWVNESSKRKDEMNNARTEMIKLLNDLDDNNKKDVSEKTNDTKAELKSNDLSSENFKFNEELKLSKYDIKETIKKIKMSIKKKFNEDNELNDISIDVDMNIDDLKKAVGDFNKLLEKNPDLCEDFKKISEFVNDKKK
jgi:ubiquitin-protein ligase